MITDRYICEAIPEVPRDKQEINFVIPPVHAFGGITKFTTTWQIDVLIDAGVCIEGIDPMLIQGRQIFISYVEGGAEQAKRLARLIKRSNPAGAAYITPKGDWVQLVEEDSAPLEGMAKGRHWKCLARGVTK